MAAESKKAALAAIIGNAAIAVKKFIAGGITGSSAMISEGIHSLVDTGNGGLLFHGLRRGARPADEHHPFGHGREVYFWSLIGAALWLAYESRSLLVGEAADPELVAAIREIALADPAVVGLGVLLNIEAQFTPGLPAEEIHAAVHRIEERIAEPYPEVSRIFIEVEALRSAAEGTT